MSEFKTDENTVLILLAVRNVLSQAWEPICHEKYNCSFISSVTILDDAQELDKCMSINFNAQISILGNKIVFQIKTLTENNSLSPISNKKVACQISILSNGVKLLSK